MLFAACDLVEDVPMNTAARISGALVIWVATQAAAASPPKGECTNLGKMYGLFTNSSLQCNFSESPAIQKTIDRLKQVCPKATEKEARSYVASGSAELDKQLRQNGMCKACREHTCRCKVWVAELSYARQPISISYLYGEEM
jgi:hypothetical protein